MSIVSHFSKSLSLAIFMLYRLHLSYRIIMSSIEHSLVVKLTIIYAFHKFLPYFDFFRPIHFILDSLNQLQPIHVLKTRCHKKLLSYIEVLCPLKIFLLVNFPKV